MTKEEAIKLLIEQQGDHGDYETAHMKADEILCDFLISLGYEEIVEEWDKIGKWYA